MAPIETLRPLCLSREAAPRERCGASAIRRLNKGLRLVEQVGCNRLDSILWLSKEALCLKRSKPRRNRQNGRNAVRNDPGGDQLGTNRRSF